MAEDGFLMAEEYPRGASYISRIELPSLPKWPDHFVMLPVDEEQQHTACGLAAIRKGWYLHSYYQRSVISSPTI